MNAFCCPLPSVNSHASIAAQRGEAWLFSTVSSFYNNCLRGCLTDIRMPGRMLCEPLTGIAARICELRQKYSILRHLLMP